MGWHDGDPVLDDYPLCVQLGGDSFFGAHDPRVVDPTTGARLLSFPHCYGGDVTPGGAFCTSSYSARTLDWIDWTGSVVQRFPLPWPTVFCDTDLNPARTRILAFCQANIYDLSPGTDTQVRDFLFGAGPPLPGALGHDRVRWLDNDLVLVPSQRASGTYGNTGCSTCANYISTTTIWSLRGGVPVTHAIDVPGVYVGRFGA